MKEYTKTIRVQAIQWTGENLEEVKTFCKKFNIFDVERDTESHYNLWIGSRHYVEQWEFIASSEMGDKPQVFNQYVFQRDYKEVSE